MNAMRCRAKSSVLNSSVSSELRTLLQRIQNQYPTSWFQARSVQTKISMLQELVVAGYLDASRGPRSSGINFKLKPSHLWPYAQ